MSETTIDEIPRSMDQTVNEAGAQQEDEENWSYRSMKE